MAHAEARRRGRVFCVRHFFTPFLSSFAADLPCNPVG